VNLFQDLGKPCAAACGIAEREELVAAGKRRSASQENVLYVIKLKHGKVTRGSLHLIKHL